MCLTIRNTPTCWGSSDFITKSGKPYSTIIVKCSPILPKDITIDNNNNICKNINVDIKQLLHSKELLTVKIGTKSLWINSNSLRITEKPQVIKYKNAGILKINKKHMYDTEKRSNIYLEVNLK